MTKVSCYIENVNCNSQVLAPLQCEHEASWLCGTDVDPRLNTTGVSNCLPCIIGKWDEAKKKEEEIFIAYSDIEEKCQKKVSDVLLSYNQIVKSDNMDFVRVDTEYVHHKKCRLSLINSYLDLLRAHGSNKFSEPQSDMSSPDFLDNYDIVFKEIKNWNGGAEKDIVGAREILTKRTTTKYGFGNELTLLTENNLKQIICSRGGSDKIRICLGVAFKQHCLEDTPPFIVTKQHSRDNELKQQVQIRRETGFDCVDVKDSSSRVYWESGAVVPLRIVSVQLQYVCQACQDNIDNTDGILCSKKHILCWNCFHEYAGHLNQPGAIAGSIDSDGNIKCPDLKCTERYSIDHVKDTTLSAEAIKAMKVLEEIRKKKHGEKEAAAAVEQHMKEFQLEQERLARIKDLDERRANVVFKEITDDLNLRCPRCNQVFEDFTECFALTCSNNRCGCQFCAWCLKESGGDDIHSHVANCPENNTGDVYGSLDAFHQHHNNKKKNRVRATLALESEEVLKFLRIMIRKSHPELGV